MLFRKFDASSLEPRMARDSAFSITFFIHAIAVLHFSVGGVGVVMAYLFAS